MTMKGTRKGQVISYDLMFASTVAVVLLGVVLVASNAIAGAAQARYEQGSSVADMALSQLVLTPGSPSDWYGMDAGLKEIHAIGLADSRGILDADKIEQFVKLEQLAATATERNELRARLGLLREGASYEFRFEVLQQLKPESYKDITTQPLDWRNSQVSAVTAVIDLSAS